MKKVLSLILILFLTACSSAGSTFIDGETEEREYIEPVNNASLYSYLNDELKEVFPEQNQNNYVFNDIGMDMPDCIVSDYYGNSVNFNDYKAGNLIIEVSASWCTHCAEQVANNDKIIENTGAKIIQYFIEGDKEAIEEFYAKEDVAIPDNIVIIPENDDLYKYFTGSEIAMVPTFYFYKDGKLTYLNVGTLTYENYKSLYDYIFGDKAITRESLTDNDGNSIFEFVRNYDDVLNDLSVASKDKLALIAESEELTVSLIGKDVSFNKVYDEEDGVLYKIDSYDRYLGRELVVFYLGNINNNLESDIALINSFAKEHEDLNILTILVDSKDISTSEAYQELGITLDTDVVSSNAMIPQAFIDTLINEYPAMLFIQDNKFTGGFYGLESADKMETAYKTFLGEESIALVSNNS